MPLINKDIAAASVATPAAGNTTIFTDASLAYIKNSAGTVIQISGAVPGIGTIGGGGPIQFNNVYGAGGFGGADDFGYNSAGSYSALPELQLGQNGYPGGALTFGYPAVYPYANNGSIVGGTSGLQLCIGSTPKLTIDTTGITASDHITCTTSVFFNDRMVLSGITGTATLVAGTVTVSSPNVDGNNLIFYTVKTLGTVSVPKAIYTSAFGSGTFTITSADATDTSVIGYMIIN
jgi:hypothetical protein